jgi:hypothetical protein
MLMPNAKPTKPRLVEVDDVPTTVRRSAYVELVDEFAKSGMRTAKVEGAKPSAVVSVRKAVATLGLTDVSVLTANGEIYLTKK